MKTWSVQDAKAQFSEMLEDCLKHGPQLVATHGSEVAVLVAIEEWRRLHGAPMRTLKDLLLSEEARGDLRVPPRGRPRKHEAA
jgi:prevent-host-death family protein